MEDNKFTIKTAFAMGERDEKYGQTWYATVEEMQFPVMFNLMEGSVQEGDQITFEEQSVQRFKSGKNQGKEYRRLKKVRVRETNPREVTTEQVGENTRLSELEERVTKIEQHLFTGLKNDRGDDSGKDEVINDVSDEAIDLSDIPF